MNHGHASSPLGIEHVPDTMYVPPLLDDRVLLEFCRAVQSFAAEHGLRDDARARLTRLKQRHQHLVNLAVLFRYAIAGDEHALTQFTSEMQCLAHEHEDAAHPPGHWTSEADDDGHGGQHDPQRHDRIAGARWSAVIDLFAGASFIAAGSDERRDRYLDAVVAAVANAVWLPLRCSRESAAYLGEGDGTLTRQQIAIVLDAAVHRLLDDDCDPVLPRPFDDQLRTLTARWKSRNPVTAILARFRDALIEVESIDATSARAGDSVRTLLKRPQAHRPDDLILLLPPHQAAEIREVASGGVVATIPPHSVSGPVLLLARADVQSVSEAVAAQSELEHHFRSDWVSSVFQAIPLYKWAFPFAFPELPRLEVVATPRTGTIAARDLEGRRLEGRPVYAGKEIVLTYELFPVGSAGNVALEVEVAGGTIVSHRMGELRFLPLHPGQGFVRLKAPNLTLQLDFPVLPMPPGSGGTEEKPLGEWDPPILGALSLVGVHAVVLHTGKVLYFSFDYRCVNNMENVRRYFADPNLGSYQLWDPATGTAGPVRPVGRNVFCAGQCQLADGTVFVAGGQDGAGAVELTGEWDKAFAAGTIPFTFWQPWFDVNNGASKDVHTYDPVSDAWTRWPDMKDNRYYPTVQVLRDGSAFVAAGLSNLQRFIASGSNWCQNDQHEVYANGALGLGPSTQQRFRSADQYPILKLLPGTSHILTHIHNTTFLFDVDSGTFVADAEFAPPPPVGRWTYPMQTGFVLLPQLEGANPRIFVVGGSTHTDFDYNTQSDAPSVRGGFIFEYDRANPLRSRWRATAGVPTVARLLSDTVLLPDGTVLIVNGIGRGAAAGHSSESIFQADLFDPVAETFTPMATPALDHPRAYHATAVLLPDGRVAVAGHTAAYNNPDAGQPASRDDTSIQVFNPPYLFRGPRPAVAGFPGELAYGQRVTVGDSGPVAVARLMMMRPCAVTHSQDMDQRAVWIPLASGDGARGKSAISFSMPTDRSLAPPGYYLLFFLSDRGVPSIATWVRLGQDGRRECDDTSGDPGGSYPTVYLGKYDSGARVISTYDGDIVIEKIDQHCNVDLESRFGSITIQQSCDQHCSVRLKARTSVRIGEKIDQHCNVTIDCQGDVTIGQKIDGNSQARITTFNGSVRIGQKIDGNSQAFITTANGSIHIGQKVDGHSVVLLFAPNGTITIVEKVGGDAEVTWQATRFDCPDTAHGNVIRY